MKNVIVTGGSRGLGLVFCEHYLAKGYRLFTLARAASVGTDKLQEKFPNQFKFVSCDLLDLASMRQTISHAIRYLGDIDILINNAAMPQGQLLAHISEDEIARIVSLNLNATILVTRIVIRKMMLQHSGTILNVSSISADLGYPGLSVYSATKGAINAFTRSLAQELGAVNIRVNAVAPGFFLSEMSRVLPKEAVEAIRRRTPTGRLSTPEDVVRACDVFVEEDFNVTGQVLNVDGGASIV